MYSERLHFNATKIQSPSFQIPITTSGAERNILSMEVFSLLFLDALK